ncbi:MAG: hypothetical protein ACK5YR_19020 [Pirellula sp.]|jgi:hypothetical protein
MIIQIGDNRIELDLLKAEEIRDKLRTNMLKGTWLLFDAKTLKAFAESIGAKTVSEAWQIWTALDEWLDHISQRNRIRADIAYWFGINAFELTDVQILSLRENLPRVRAQKTIEDGNYDPTDYERVYQLFQQAFDDENLARKRQTESFKLYLQKASKNPK